MGVPQRRLTCNLSSLEKAYHEVLGSTFIHRVQMMEACTASFQECAKDPRKRSDGMSILIAHGAEVSSRTLVKLATVSTVEELDDIFLGGVSSVDNPLIPGTQDGHAGR